MARSFFPPECSVQNSDWLLSELIRLEDVPFVQHPQGDLAGRGGRRAGRVARQTWRAPPASDGQGDAEVWLEL